MTLVEKHFKETAYLVRAIDKTVIAEWLLNEGYFPEQYVLPPSFTVKDFKLKTSPYYKNLNALKRHSLVTISYPKSMLTSRVFGIQHPFNYHDIVFHLIEDWDNVVNHLFHKDLKIFTYSFPIPINAREVGRLSNLRSGRMIYEWIEMAENDIVAEAYKYNFIVRADITNFYNSVYTHSIGWALHGREQAFKDNDFLLTGNKLDKLIQYANDARTNGIPVGSALSDLIAEIVLTSIDRKVSYKLREINFVGTRFKDDYRILCNSEEEAKKILKVLADELVEFNLLINEHKTKVFTLPDGLYRQHNGEYFLYSVKDKESISFKTFELTLLRVLEINRKYPGTSILEKYFSELYDNNQNLKIRFSANSSERHKQILKLMSLLMLVKRESEKTICYVLAVCDEIYLKYRSHELKKHLISLIVSETKTASKRKSVFELVWLVFFSRYLNLGIGVFSEIIDKELLETWFLKSIISSKQIFFNDSKIKLFINPKKCRSKKLSKRLAVFNRSKE
jgi:hypothetical protein